MPEYLDVTDVLGFYADLFGRTDDQAASQLRDRALLEGALARPLNYAIYQDADLALQAAALTHGVAEGQAFVDGNKRVAVVCLEVFLTLNGFALDAPQEALAAWIIDLAFGLTVDDLARRLREHLTPLRLV
jgi:death on curing protein